MIAADIYYERIGYYKHYQIEAVPSSSLISDIGGQVGLWLGISIVSIYEILQVLVIQIYRLGFCFQSVFFLHYFPLKVEEILWIYITIRFNYRIYDFHSLLGR